MMVNRSLQLMTDKLTRSYTNTENRNSVHVLCFIGIKPSEPFVSTFSQRYQDYRLSKGLKPLNFTVCDYMLQTRRCHVYVSVVI